MNKKLYVGNLSYSVRDEDLMEAFGRFGHVESAIVMSDRDSGRSKGFGFVEMSTEQEAQSAIEGLHDTDLAGRMLMVNIAKPREERPRSGGFNRGGGGGYNGGGGGYGGGDRGGYNGGGGGYGGDRGGYR